MPGQVMLALILLTLALIYYTIGFWSERITPIDGRMRVRIIPQA